MVAVGETLDGRFVLEAELGRGGMGQVFRAYDQRLHRKIALKIILADPHATAAEWAEARARLLREARAAAAFDHPNAVSIFDLGEVDGLPFIAMEFVPGTDLRRFVGDASVPWSMKLRWLVDVAHALAAAHLVGLVHRDVKPENVMLRDNGRIKVLDFGIARRASLGVDANGPTHDGAIPTLTGAGRLVGTPVYMPPEQMHGQAIDGRADEYAWGVMAYELLSGAPPWSGDDLVALMAAALVTPAPPLGPRAPEVAPEVVRAIERTLAKNAADRFPSLAELIAVVEPFAQPASPGSLPPGPARAVAGSAAPSVSGATAMAMRRTTDGHVRGPVAGGAIRWRLPALLGALITTLVIGSVVVAAVTIRARRAAKATSAASASPAPSAPIATSMLDLPKPSAATPAALDAYLAGRRAERDGADIAARAFYRQAVASDPSLAAAYLRLADLLRIVSATAAREQLHKARELAAALDARDRVVLDALSAIFTRERPDYAEMERLYADATARYPADAEMFERLAGAEFNLGRFADADASVDRALALDPKYAAAWLVKGDIQQYGGTREAALAAFRKCEDLAAGGLTHCRKRIVWLEAEDGKCADVEATAKRAVASDPGDADGYALLAMASVALGKPREAIDEIRRQEWSRMPAEDRMTSEALESGDLDALAGAFDSAEKNYRDAARIAENSQEAFAHLVPAWSQAVLLREIGEDAKAAAAASDYLRRKDAWTPSLGLDDFAVEVDMDPVLWATERAAGKMNRAEFATRIDAWAKGWEERLPRAYLGYVWIYGYAATVETKEDAEAALALLPKYGPLPWYRPGLDGDAIVGHVYLLAGRDAEALPMLEYAVKTCNSDDIITYVRSFAWLGAARERAGDADGACSAYREVVRRWGKTRSTTLRAARARMAATGCKAK